MTQRGGESGAGGSQGGGTEEERVTRREVWRMWLPLAASWLLMGAELPLLSAVVARLADPEIHLAAYGGVVFPVALIIESPIIMLLAASTALSRDWDSYRKLRRFMVASGAALTLLHIAVAFTPLYYVVAREMIGAPEEIIEPARIGLMFMTPWTWAIACRRFHQGVLIRFGRSDAVGWGTAVRLAADAAVLFAGYLWKDVAGIIVATAAVSAGVLTEALYAWWRVRPVVNQSLKKLPVQPPQITRSSFLHFYIPLALTTFVGLAVQPVLTAAMSRMPMAVASLAVWPALNGVTFMIRAMAFAYNEVVVALVGRRGGYAALRRFTRDLALGLTGIMLLMTATPFAPFWFERVTGLRAELAGMGSTAMWAALLLPALGVLASWYQGLLVHQRQTRVITEAVLLFFVVCGGALFLGAVWWGASGLLVAMVAMTVGQIVQAWWMWIRSGGVRDEIKRAGV